MSNRGKKPSDKGQEEKKHEESMKDQTVQKKKRENSPKDKAAGGALRDDSKNGCVAD